MGIREGRPEGRPENLPKRPHLSVQAWCLKERQLPHCKSPNLTLSTKSRIMTRILAYTRLHDFLVMRTSDSHRVTYFPTPRRKEELILHRGQKEGDGHNEPPGSGRLWNPPHMAPSLPAGGLSPSSQTRESLQRPCRLSKGPAAQGAARDSWGDSTAPGQVRFQVPSPWQLIPGERTSSAGP